MCATRHAYVPGLLEQQQPFAVVVTHLLASSIRGKVSFHLELSPSSAAAAAASWILAGHVPGCGGEWGNVVLQGGLTAQQLAVAGAGGMQCGGVGSTLMIGCRKKYSAVCARRPGQRRRAHDEYRGLAGWLAGCRPPAHQLAASRS